MGLLLDMLGFGKDEEDEECLTVVGFDEELVDGIIFGLDFVILEMMVLIWVLKFGGVVIFCIIVILFIFCLVIIWLFC